MFKSHVITSLERITPGVTGTLESFNENTQKWHKSLNLLVFHPCSELPAKKLTLMHKTCKISRWIGAAKVNRSSIYFDANGVADCRVPTGCLNKPAEFVTFYFARNYIDLFQELKTVNKKNARN